MGSTSMGLSSDIVGQDACDRLRNGNVLALKNWNERSFSYTQVAFKDGWKHWYSVVHAYYASIHSCFHRRSLLATGRIVPVFFPSFYAPSHPQPAIVF